MIDDTLTPHLSAEEKKIFVTLRSRALARRRQWQRRSRMRGESAFAATLGSHVSVTHRTVAEVTTYPQLVEMIDARRLALGISLLELDARAGFSGGYCGHLLNPDSKTGKSLGAKSLPAILGALGLRLALVQVRDDA